MKEAKLPNIDNQDLYMKRPGWLLLACMHTYMGPSQEVKGLIDRCGNG
jgi:hypothetical protein